MDLYIFEESSRAAVYGIGTYVKELTVALKDSGIKICVVHLRSDKKDMRKEEIDKIHHIHIPTTINQNTLLSFNKQSELYYKNVVYLLRMQIKDKETPIFHLNYPSKKFAEELKKSFDCSLVMTVHFFEWCASLYGNVACFRKILTNQESDYGDELTKTVNHLYQKEKELFQTTDHIICLSEFAQHILQDDYQIEPDKITVIYNGITDRNTAPDKLSLRQKYHIPDIPVFLFVGRLDDIKGLKYALQAFKIVLETQPHCHFIIAGDGTFNIYMKECEDVWMHVTWTGLISKDKLYDLYAIADIGVMPSFHEQCSYVAIEMMMHGVPLIASNTTGLKEMVADGVTGMHIPVIEHSDSAAIDTDLLAEKMLYLLQHPAERKRMGANARKRYEERYSSGVFRQNMLDLYESLFRKDVEYSVRG